ncbi:hypothetical protein MMC20_005400 [Loxospora ochrophaea]|nr:hypothetical protein [Loxospora ochrophaea]
MAINIRSPGTIESQSDFVPPSPQQLSGTWYVTHSTLPMWKSKRNVTITYKELDAGLDDLVSYQSLNSDKVKTVHGVDKTSASGWDWRGKGWLVIATSHWEVLGYGDEWAVTYFAKTLFTPAGLDIYSKSGNGLSPETLQAIRAAIGAVDHPEIKRLSNEIFEIRHDNAR